MRAGSILGLYKAIFRKCALKRGRTGVRSVRGLSLKVLALKVKIEVHFHFFSMNTR